MSDIHALTVNSIAQVLSQNTDYRVLYRVPFMPNIVADPNADRSEWKKGIVIDTETTGLDIHKVKVIELGIAEFWYTEAEGIKAFGRCQSWLNDPFEPLSDEVKRVTKITDEMLHGQAINYTEAADLRDGAEIVIAHNAAYDRPIVERELAFLNLHLLSWACSSEEIEWKEKYGSPSKSLTVIAWASGLFFDGHRANHDCAALLYLLAMIRLGGRSPLQTLIEGARRPVARLFATGAAFEKKDALKARAYSWNPDRKVWWVDISDPYEADEEQKWLKTEILNGRDPSVQIIKATDRYSLRAA